MPRWPNSTKRTKSGPKRIPIDWNEVARWLQEGLGTTQCANRIGVVDETLHWRFRQEKPDPDCECFSQFKAKHRATGDGLLIQWQFDKCRKGNVDMLKWVGRYRLGQGRTDILDDLEDAQDFRSQVLDEQEKLKRQKLIDQEVERKVAAALLERGISVSGISPEQPLLHQGQRGEQNPVQDELGPKNPVE